jgi:lipopolysaccharide export system protein LptC
MDLRNCTILIALLFGAVSSGILLLRNTPDEVRKSEDPRMSIGYYMNRAHLIATGDDGYVLFRASARTASQDFDEGTINLQGVRVTYDPITDIPWTLQANSGKIPPDGNIIQLTGDVVARTKNDGNTAMIINTDYLELDTETYVANTEQKVAIEYTSNIVFATGMRAFFKEDRVQLISNVNGKFAP